MSGEKDMSLGLKDLKKMFSSMEYFRMFHFRYQDNPEVVIEAIKYPWEGNIKEYLAEKVIYNFFGRTGFYYDCFFTKDIRAMLLPRMFEVLLKDKAVEKKDEKLGWVLIALSWVDNDILKYLSMIPTGYWVSGNDDIYIIDEFDINLSREEWKKKFQLMLENKENGPYSMGDILKKIGRDKLTEEEFIKKLSHYPVGYHQWEVFYPELDDDSMLKEALRSFSFIKEDRFITTRLGEYLEDGTKERMKRLKNDDPEFKKVLEDIVSNSLKLDIVYIGTVKYITLLIREVIVRELTCEELRVYFDVLYSNGKI